MLRDPNGRQGIGGSDGRQENEHAAATGRAAGAAAHRASLAVGGRNRGTENAQVPRGSASSQGAVQPEGYWGRATGSSIPSAESSKANATAPWSYLEREGDFLKLRVRGYEVQYRRAEQLERRAIDTQRRQGDEPRQFLPLSVVLHFTGTPPGSEEGILRSWEANAKYGTHFLVTAEGTIYQAASLDRTTQHLSWYDAGNRRARCATEGTCTRSGEPEYQLADAEELAKSFPERFPASWEAVGIELVNKPTGRGYPAIPRAQYEATMALVDALQKAFGIRSDQVLPHVDIETQPPGEGILPGLSADRPRPATHGRPVHVLP